MSICEAIRVNLPPLTAGTLLGMLEFITNALTASRAQALKSAYDRGEFTGELLSGDRLLRTIAGPPISV